MKHTEEWRPVKGLEGIYEVSNRGRVRSLDRIEVMKNGVARPRKGRILKPNVKANGYYCFHYSYKGKTIDVSVHRAVGDAFLPNPLHLPCINHKDGNKLNNNVENLEWCTYQYNNTYADRVERSVVSMNCRKVKKLSLDGSLIEEYRSCNAAAVANGIRNSNLYQTLHRNQRIRGGFVWKYSDEA